MELKKIHLGSFVFIAKLNREVEICEENKAILIAHNKREFFITPKPVKTEVKKRSAKEKEKKSNNVSPTTDNKQRS